MICPIVPSEIAKIDVFDIASYLEQQSEKAGFRFIDSLERTYHLLAQMPEIGEKCHFRSSEMRNSRVWPVRNFLQYLIFYRVEIDRIEILRVLHGSQDYLTRFGN
ncbi:MAG: type II toxin-antitoxin system RelE/ParE family toxin [Thermoguttaceae bacterium]